MKKIITFLLCLFSVINLSSQSRGITFEGQLKYSKTINDVWGWADTANNKEYAMVGVADGLSIVDVTNPASPVEEQFVSGPTSVWRDMKNWKQYGYMVHDFASSGSDQGVVIVNMRKSGTPNQSFKSFQPSITVNGSTDKLDRAHNIYIDENGVLYVFGSNVANGGALMFDVKTDPMNPKFLGAYDGNYLHDGVARGDTLWGAAINVGTLNVIDVTNKNSPSVMARQNTPNSFTHNVWFSDDNQTVFTTDERSGAYVTSYDVSDLSNITELDRIQTQFGNTTIPHNAHVKGDFVVTSYYTAGLQIVDATKPTQMVETAWFDSSPASGDGFGGAWGAYPWLPSGNILLSDRGEGLFILSSSYPRATYLEVLVKDSLSGNPINNASVNVLNSGISGQTNLNGNFKDAQADTGMYTLVVSKSGYENDTIQLNMKAGKTINLTVSMLDVNFDLRENEIAAPIQLFPNPAGSEFSVSGIPAEAADGKLRLTAVNGGLVRELELQQAELQTFETNLPQGIYLVEMITDEGIIQRGKLVIER